MPEGPMDTIADHLLARSERSPTGARGGGRGLDLARGGGGVPGPGRAGWLADRAPGPFHVAVLLDNVPEFAFWLGATALSGGGHAWAPTPPTGAPTWPATWPTPAVSSW